jgi:hypothetical protein
MQRFIVPVVVAVVLIAGQAYLQGIWTGRWNQKDVSQELQSHIERMSHIPTAFGDWDSIESPISQRELDASGSLSAFSRRFASKSDPSKVVEVFVVCGLSRDIAQHTPDQCYPLSGFDEVEDPQAYDIEIGGDHKNLLEFRTNRFRKAHSIMPQDLRIFWSFSGDGKWESPSIPKFSLAHFPALYKIYVNTSVRGATSTRADDSAGVKFLKDFMPILNSTLFPPESESGKGEAASKPSDSAVKADATSSEADKSAK